MSAESVRARLRRLVIDSTLDSPAGQKYLDREVSRLDAWRKHPRVRSTYGGDR